MKTLSILTLLVASLTAPAAQAQDAGEFDRAMAQLDRQVALLESLEPSVMRLDLGRLFVLRLASQKVKASATTVGLSHMQTFREYQNLIIAFRYSTSFLKEIATEETQEAITELQQIADAIAEARGFDDSPYTRITESVYAQIKKLMDQLLTLSVSDDLKKKIQDLTPELGTLIATARQGDRPRTYAAAKPVYEKIAALYSGDTDLFGPIARSNAAFNITLEIMGLNEYYLEVAQDFDGVK